MKNNPAILFMCLMISLSSCVNITDGVVLKPQVGDVIRVNRVASSLQPIQEESVEIGNYGNYVNYLKETDNLIGISSATDSETDSHTLAYYAGPAQAFSSKSIYNKTIKIRLNGVPIDDMLQKEKTDAHKGQIFGAEAHVSVQAGVPTKSAMTDGEIDMYIPEDIQLLAPPTYTDRGCLPLCYYDGMKIKWNSDSKNENGVIFVTEWFGEMVLGADIPNAHIRRTAVFPDNGSATLPSSIFDGIPDTAVIHSTIVRGNVDLLTIDDESYKVFCETHATTSFILVRYITKK